MKNYTSLFLVQRERLYEDFDTKLSLLVVLFWTMQKLERKLGNCIENSSMFFLSNWKYPKLR